MAHFLGTVVAYEALHARPDLHVYLLVTFGSPLALPRRRQGAFLKRASAHSHGAGHLLFAGREGIPPEADAVRKMVTTVIASVVQER